MKISKYILLVLIGLMVSVSPSVADQEHPIYEGSQAFQKMKQLAGQWEGTVNFGEGTQTIKASYRVTSAGSVLVETIFEGTPNEMVTIYHDDKNKRLGLTHYCGLNNQPKLALIGAKENTLEFDLAKDGSVDAQHEPHMHALTLTFAGKNEIKQNWTQFAEGEKKKVVEITFKRVL
jgi:outer membrane lipoprotein-sorting protein